MAGSGIMFVISKFVKPNYGWLSDFQTHCISVSGWLNDRQKLEKIYKLPWSQDESAVCEAPYLSYRRIPKKSDKDVKRGKSFLDLKIKKFRKLTLPQLGQKWFFTLSCTILKK